MKTGFLFKKRSKADSLGLVYIALYLKDRVELIATGQKVDQADWDPTTGYLYRRRHLKKIDQTLIALLNEVNLAELRVIARREVVTPKAVKDEYTRENSKRLTDTFEAEKKEKENHRLLIDLVNYWLENSLFPHQPSTRKTIKNSLKYFTDYLTKKYRGNASLNELKNTSLVKGYEKYLQDDLKFADSTHGRIVKHLTWFLVTVGYDVSTIKLRNSKKTIVSLTEEEVIKLENHDVSHTELQQRCKDLFLLAVYLGLRISDLQRINPTMIHDGKIVMVLKKNKKDVVIPILKKTKAIFDRYGNHCPKVVEQVLNRTIKDICRDAGIDQLVTVRKNIGGQNFDEQVPKYKLISSHVGGKTFISLAGKWYNLNPAEIASLVGKDLKTLLTSYFNLPKEEAIRKMIEGEKAERQS